MTPGVEITAHVKDGFFFSAADGSPLTLKLVDNDGVTVAFGAALSKELMAVAVKAYEGFWLGNGGLVVLKGE